MLVDDVPCGLFSAKSYSLIAKFAFIEKGDETSNSIFSEPIVPDVILFVPSPDQPPKWWCSLGVALAARFVPSVYHPLERSIDPLVSEFAVT